MALPCPTLNASRNVFATDLFRTITAKEQNSKRNVIYSPASIHCCLALALMGTEGETSVQLRTALRFCTRKNTEIAEKFGEFLKTEFKQNKQNGTILKMANRIYVNKHLTISKEFNKIAKNNFETEAEQLNFADGASAIKQINQWVEQQTEKRIQNLLQAGAINDATSAILVNAIYFMGKWTNRFAEHSTRKEDFYLSPTNTVQVDTMHQKDKFRYAEIAEIDACCIELPYELSDMSMLIILPNQLDGLRQLEEKLAKIDLDIIGGKLSEQKVQLSMPKFKIEFDLDLKQPLQELGVKDLFSDRANLSGLFTNAQQQKVSDVKHKAYLDVNETGSEAAASTFLKAVPISHQMQKTIFRADHPFVFAIRNNSAVFFAGHVAKF